MKKVISLMAVAAASFITTAECALPPLYESIREFSQLLAIPDLSTHLNSGEAIVDIRRDDNGFVITTTHQTLHVEIVYEPTGLAGPAQFHFVFPSAEPLH